MGLIHVSVRRLWRSMCIIKRRLEKSSLRMLRRNRANQFLNLRDSIRGLGQDLEVIAPLNIICQHLKFWSEIAKGLCLLR
jgi:hypothetical protein